MKKNYRKAPTFLAMNAVKAVNFCKICGECISEFGQDLRFLAVNFYTRY